MPILAEAIGMSRNDVITLGRGGPQKCHGRGEEVPKSDIIKKVPFTPFAKKRYFFFKSQKYHFLKIAEKGQFTKKGTSFANHKKEGTLFANHKKSLFLQIAKKGPFTIYNKRYFFWKSQIMDLFL